jgi:hypothetical protein
MGAFMSKLKIIARILEPSDYLWHAYDSDQPMSLTTRNGHKTIEMVKGTRYGIRPSTSGSAIRMITDKFGPTIVFTLTMDEKRALLAKSVPAPKGALQQVARAGK